MRTLYNRWNRWLRRAIWRGLFEALREVSADAFHTIDSTTAKAHRSAAGGKGGRNAGYRPIPRRAHDQDPRGLRRARTPIAIEVTPGQLGDVRAAIGLLGQLPQGRICAADTAYDSDGLRQFLRLRGTLPVIPNNPTRKLHAFDQNTYKRCN